jgi:hypothetical protein
MIDFIDIWSISLFISFFFDSDILLYYRKALCCCRLRNKGYYWFQCYIRSSCLFPANWLTEFERRTCWWFSLSQVIRRLGLRAFSFRKTVEWRRYDIARPGRRRVGITSLEEGKTRLQKKLLFLEGITVVSHICQSHISTFDQVKPQLRKSWDNRRLRREQTHSLNWAALLARSG